MVALHADEALQRWRRRQLSQHSRHVQFVQRVREDEVLAAHLHGLVVAGASAWTVAQERCQRGTPADHFVRTWALLAAQGGPPQAPRLLDALSTLAGEPAALGAGCDTLRWALSEWQAQALVVECVGLVDGPLGDALLRLCGQQRWSVNPALLRTMLEHPRPGTRQAAYEHCASLGLHVHLDLLIEHSDCAGAAAAAFRLGEREHSVPRLIQLATAPQSACDEASALNPQDALVELCAALPLPESRAAWHAVQAAQAERPEPTNPSESCTTTMLLAAAEASNDAAHLPWLLKQLHDPAQRDSAEAALGWLTGFEPASAFADRTDDPAYSYSAADLEHWLDQQPLPRSSQQRWLAGATLDRSSVFETLWYGRLRYRHHAARHLAWAAPHAPLVCLLAPAEEQIGWLNEADSAYERESRHA